MLANELRLGNLILTGGLIGEVQRIDKDGVMTELKHTVIDINKSLGIEPIPLTEDWVIKFGFIEHRFYKSDLVLWLDKDIDSDCFFIYQKNTATLSCLSSDGGDTSGVNNSIKYVHQLQNIYFAITGKEIVIK